MMIKRPLGVTILAGLQFFYSGFGLLLSLSVLVIPQWRQFLVDGTIESLKLQFQTTGSSADPQAQAMMLGMVPTLILVFGGIGVLLSLVGGLLGYGLWKLKQWAWILTLIWQILQVLSLGQSLVSSIALGSASIPASTLSQLGFQLAIALLILFYLFRPKVRQAFKSPQSSV